MKTTMRTMIGAAAFAVLAAAAVCGRAQEPGAEAKVLGMKSVPDGHYLVNLQAEDREQFVNLEVRNGSAKAVNSSNARLAGLEGKFRLVGNGVFEVSLYNGKHRATQFWVFQTDGSALVREMPDRGEKQRALRVPDGSLPERSR